VDAKILDVKIFLKFGLLNTKFIPIYAKSVLWEDHIFGPY